MFFLFCPVLKVGTMEQQHRSTDPLWEMQNRRLSLDLLTQNLHFNKTRPPASFSCILTSEKPESRDHIPKSSPMLTFLSGCCLGSISAFGEQREWTSYQLGIVPIIIMSYNELSSGIVGKWCTGRLFVTSGKVNILLRATSEGTTGYYFRTKGKNCRGKHFSWNVFFSPSQNTMSDVWGEGNTGGGSYFKIFLKDNWPHLINCKSC